jgi:predicted SAM-dependent methyltransferase
VIVLNVGGGASREIPATYKGWDQRLLDIDPSVKPDICCDAKDMGKLKASSFDAVYCSHNLEHFYRHDVPVVLSGFHHVLKQDGFAQIAVPDVMALMREVVEGKRDVMDTWYRAPSGPISFHDVLYGWNQAMEAGNIFYSHKCGFSEKSLGEALREAGFTSIYTSSDGMSLHAYAFKRRPTEARRRTLGI